MKPKPSNFKLSLHTTDPFAAIQKQKDLLNDIVAAWLASDGTALEDALHRARNYLLNVEKG